MTPTYASGGAHGTSKPQRTFSHHSRDSTPDSASMSSIFTLASGGSYSKSARMAASTSSVLASMAAEISLISSSV